jgi:hypothetical protein
VYCQLQKRAAPEPPAELAFLGWLKNQIRAQKNAGIKNMISFLYLYDGENLGSKAGFLMPESEGQLRQ